MKIRAYLLMLLILFSSESALPENLKSTEVCANPFSLRSNLLYDAALVPNLGFDFHLSKNLSLSVGARFANWNIYSDNLWLRTYGAEVNFRYYPKPYQFTGHHFGIVGQAFTYDFNHVSHKEIGGVPGGKFWKHPHWSAGIEYGYSFPLSSRLHLDLSAAFGYSSGIYHEYYHDKDCVVWKSTNRRRWIGPVKAEIALVWQIGRQHRKTRESEKSTTLPPNPPHENKNDNNINDNNDLNEMNLKYPILSAATALALNSCEYRELCYDHSGHADSLKITFNWTEQPTEELKGMAVWFYPVDGKSRPLRFDYSGIEGGYASVPEGTYNIIAYNNDTEFSLSRNTADFYEHELYTRTGDLLEPLINNRSTVFTSDPPRPKDTENQPVVVTPDALYGCTYQNFTVTGDASQELILFPYDLLCHYSYEVRDVKNLQSVNYMSAVISGMIPSMKINGPIYPSTAVTLPVPAGRSDDATIRGEFLTFGCNTDSLQKFGIYLWLRDGTSIFYGADYDISDQIRNAEDKKHVHFIIEGLELPEVKETSNGWSATFNEWVENEKQIIM